MDAREQENICWFSGEAMTAWLVVPGDWRAPEARPGPFTLFRARRSQFAWVYPRPRQEELPGFYAFDGYYTHDAGMGLTPTLLDRMLRKAAWTFDRSVHTTPEWVRHTFGAPRRILDVGAGDGFFAALLASGGHDVTCVEIDPVCRERIAARGLDVREGSAEELPVDEGERFGAVTMLHVLEHTLDPARALAAAHEVLEPGGLLVVEVPNQRCLGFDRLAYTWAFFDVPRHLSFFTARSLRQAVEHAGFVVEKEEMRGFTRQYLPEWIEEEQRIHDALAAAGVDGLPRRASKAAAWIQLARALGARTERRYDSVRVIARRR